MGRGLTSVRFHPASLPGVPARLRQAALRSSVLVRFGPLWPLFVSVVG